MFPLGSMAFWILNKIKLFKLFYIDLFIYGLSLNEAAVTNYIF